MRKLFITTALTTGLATALALTPAVAQEQSSSQSGLTGGEETESALDQNGWPEVEAPEGYNLSKDRAVTTRDLDGADVYGPGDEKIGTVYALLFKSGELQISEPRASGESLDDTTGDTGGDTGGDMSGDTTGTGSGDDTTMSGGAGGSEGGADTTAGSASDTGDAGTSGSDGDTGDTATTGTTGDTTTMDSDMGSEGSTSDGTAATDSATGSSQGELEISEAIIDVGGFLGIGSHRVAVPVEELAIYTKDDDSDDIRVYLPRTKEDLEAMPEFDQDEVNGNARTDSHREGDGGTNDATGDTSTNP
ncbi:hypothetical protein [Pontibaca methylaminivorans]|uniref:PRC-barrel domain-containing protein n=1 Tax=Pontibaca methylaminivorans TaxID=515897 RepID=A0A1R3X8V8_9RHOB|nr:hypothetical protein [Pontibaca methylaminivorans]SIT86700.1 hypothetical protein SAMN05421849_2378 [Pontibaca methylaminivorans]